jgi:pSer/pThr/pTyr-binding forkhead associated (FHA) protein
MRSDRPTPHAFAAAAASRAAADSGVDDPMLADARPAAPLAEDRPQSAEMEAEPFLPEGARVGCVAVSAPADSALELAELILDDFPVVTLTEIQSRATVGRKADQGHAWVLEQRHVSGTHFEVELIDSAFGRELYIQDLNSLNGTFVNQTRVEAQKKVRLNTGDKIDFVDTHKQKDKTPPSTLTVRIDAAKLIARSEPSVDDGASSMSTQTTMTPSLTALSSVGDETATPELEAKAKRRLEDDETPEAKSRRTGDSHSPPMAPAIPRSAKQIQDRWSSTVFVGGIPKNANAADKLQIFFKSKIGSCHLMPGRADGGWGVFTFTSPEAAKECLRRYSGYDVRLEGIPVDVKEFFPVLQVDSVGTDVTEDVLRRHFSKFGIVEKVEPTATWGIWIIKFSSLEDKLGLATALATDNIDIDGRAVQIKERYVPTHILTWFEPCRFWTSTGGCWKESSCRFAHW